ncbi:hypothetical protein CR513_39535, partial [Mucuna pruriens]
MGVLLQFICKGKATNTFSCIDQLYTSLPISSIKTIEKPSQSSSKIDKKFSQESCIFTPFHFNLFLFYNFYDDKKYSTRSYLDDLKFLTMGPIDCAEHYNAYNINGFKFRILERDQGLKTQNSGIFVIFGTRSYASSMNN